MDNEQFDLSSESTSSSQPSSPRSMEDDGEQDDTQWREKIGPWKENDLKPLGDFDPNTNFVVRAAAGSGKTTALVARMVALVREGEAEIQDLAAITFTRKAASEMKERLYEELLSARQVLSRDKGTYSGTEAERKRVDQALAHVQQCFVGTVHSFCGRILRERALEAGLPPDFAVGIDERDEADLRARIWEGHVQEAHRKNGALDELEAIGLRPNDLTGLLETISAYPELELYTDGASTAPDLDPAVGEAQDFVARWQAQRPDDALKDRDKAQEALDRAEGAIENNPLDTPARQAEVLELLVDGYSDSTEKGNVTLSAWGQNGSDSYEAARRLRDGAYPEIVETVLYPALSEWRAFVHAQAIAFVRPAAEKYLDARREEGLLTHHDVLYRTRNLLRDNPEVRRKAFERTPRLLVDEFQDTDPLQAEILFYLTSQDRTMKDWTECVPRPGSLFIVGDDKQSIYRFRRADLNVFKDVVQQINRTGGQEVPLTKNFRSYRQICTFCDEVFEESFAASEPPRVQAEYTAFTPDKPLGQDEHALRRLQVEYKRGNSGDQIAEDTAEQIAGFIQRALDEGASHELAGDPTENPVFEESASPEDFLILTGGKKHLSTYGEALARVGIPFTITGSNDLGDSDDLKDFADLLTCALRPGDELAAVSYLQGGLCGFSDDALYRLRQAFDAVSEEPFQFIQPHPPGNALGDLSETLASRYERAYLRVRAAYEEVRSRRPGRALLRVAEDAGLLAGAAHSPDEESGSIRAGRLLRAFAVVRKRAAEGNDWAEVLSVLQDILDGEVDADGLTLESGSDGAVRIMNLHQVKGLEAPVVFLADPYPKTGRNHSPTKHIRRREGAPDQLVAPMTKETPGGDVVTHPPLGWEGDDGFQEIEAAHEAAEKKRLMYVAATRAERLLVVSEYHHKSRGRLEGDWASLSDNLQNVPVLTPEPPTGENKDRPAPNLEEHRKKRRSAVNHVKTPSFEVSNVSDERERTGSSPDVDIFEVNSEGYGTILGQAVHALLEKMVRQGEMIDQVSTGEVERALEVAEEQTRQQDGSSREIPEEAVEIAENMVDRFLSGPLAERVEAADQAFAEYPVSALTDEGPPRERRGVIDLVYKDAEGWHIVDYKTDRVAQTSLPSGMEGHEYADQVRVYAKVWEDLTGETVTDACLWFADADALVDVL